MNDINKIDKYGFCDLIYTDYWEKNKVKAEKLLQNGANYFEALKKYLECNAREEVLDIYNQYIKFDINYFIENNHFKYIDTRFDFDYNALDDKSVSEYLDSKEVKDEILKEIDNHGILSKDHTRKYTQKFDLDLFDINNIHEFIDIGIIEKRIKEEIAKEQVYADYDIDKLRDFTIPLDYEEAKYGIDEDERIELIQKCKCAPEKIDGYNNILKEIQDHVISIIQLNNLDEQIKFFDRHSSAINNGSYDETTGECNYPLAIAVWAKQYDIVEYFLKNGAKIELDCPEGSALFIAVLNEDVKMIELLLNFESEINEDTWMGAFDYAQEINIIRVLLDYKVAKVDLEKILDTDNEELLELLLHYFIKDKNDNEIFDVFRSNYQIKREQNSLYDKYIKVGQRLKNEVNDVNVLCQFTEAIDIIENDKSKYVPHATLNIPEIDITEDEIPF